MQTLDVENPGLPDLQFVLLVLALCTSDLRSLNVPEDVRHTIFHRCWALMHDRPPPMDAKDRVLDLRDGTDLTLEAMVEVIRRALGEQGITELRWDHPSSEPTRASTSAARPLIERMQTLYPPPPDMADDPHRPL